MTDQELMARAIELAVENVRSGRGGPFAALVVRDGTIVAEGTNLVTSTNDPTAHAEVVAIRNACRKLRNFQLTGCDIFTTCEPCPMCMGAIYWARPARVVYAATRADAARAGFGDAHIYRQLRLPHRRRGLAIHQLMRTQAQAPFREWKLKSDKIRY
jgi:tRNA(Arg) A34 adenosine deaminase TadA